MIPRTTQRSNVLVETPCFSASLRQGARCFERLLFWVVRMSPPVSTNPGANMMVRLVRVNRHCAHRHQRARTATPRKPLKD